MSEYIWVKIGKGDTWLPGFDEVNAWGGWTDWDGYIKPEVIPEIGDDHEGWLRRNGYPTGADWLKSYFQNDKWRDEYTDEEPFWFLVPLALHDRVFGPKFNEWGEVCP